MFVEKLGAIQLLPAVRGRNVHLTGGISAAGVVQFERRRGSFDSQAADGWLRRLMINWETAGNRLQDSWDVNFIFINVLLTKLFLFCNSIIIYKLKLRMGGFFSLK